MAQPNVVREPSMEEILASIRRIIESNEPISGSTLSHPASAGSADQHQPTDEYEAGSDEAGGDEPGHDVAANDPGVPLRNDQNVDPSLSLRDAPLRESIGFTPLNPERAAKQDHETNHQGREINQDREAGRDQRANPAQPGENRSLSLADVAARVRAASSRQQETLRQSGGSAEGQPEGQRERQQEVPQSHEVARSQETGAQRAGAASPEPASVAASAPIAAPAPSESAASVSASSIPATPMRQEPSQPVDTPPVNPRSASVTSSPASAPASGRQEPIFAEVPVSQQTPVQQPAAALQPPAAAPTGDLPVKADQAANLLSADAGAQVAKSFGELAAVLDGIEHRSVEEMAGEMLRPMLQEWLDDNLPTLVERLVREEIERVARGQRR